MFCIGHAVELYLKAVFLKLDPTVDVTKKSHRVGEMLAEVQNRAPGLLAGYTLRDLVYQKFMSNPLIPLAQTADPDYEHYIQHQELYWVARYLQDLKYLGTVHKQMPDQFAVLAMSCNPHWETFFHELRRYLAWPEQGAWFDHIGRFMASNSAPPPVQRFLAAL